MDQIGTFFRTPEYPLEFYKPRLLIYALALFIIAKLSRVLFCDLPPTQVVCVAGTVLAISFILVLKPLHDAHMTDRNMKLAMSNGFQFNPETVGSCPISPPSRRQVDDVDEQVVDELGSGGDHRPRDMGSGGSTSDEVPSTSIVATSLHAPLVVKVS